MALPPRCSVKEEYLNGRRGTSVQGKRTAEYAIRVLATNLIVGTVTVRAQSKARTLAEVEQRIDPKLRQDRYEFQLVEFLETVQRTESVDARPECGKLSNDGSCARK